jgi:hypothetical protein
MSFVMKMFAAPLAALALLPGLAVSPAAAQTQDSSTTTGRKIAEIVVFGNDPCPRSTDDEVVVCTRVDDRYRYRMPEAYRPSGSFQQRQSWANKARTIERVGRTGIQSCSPVGPAGYTGCMEQMIRQGQAESAEEADQASAPQR